MEFDFSFLEFVLISLVILFGSASQAAIGIGLNLFAIPLLMLINTKYAPGPVFAASLLLSALALWRVPARVDRSEFNVAFVGLLLGTAVAAIIVSQMETATLIRVLGILVILAVGLIFSGWSAPITRINLFAAGTSSGLLGTIAGVHAPPIALLYQGQNPDRFRGAILPFVCIGNGFSIVALYFAGRFGIEQLQSTLVLLPGVVLGLWFAPKLAKILSAKTIRSLVLAISAISGALLVIR